MSLFFSDFLIEGAGWQCYWCGHLGTEEDFVLLRLDEEQDQPRTICLECVEASEGAHFTPEDGHAD